MFRKTSVALAALLVATTAAISPAAHAATKISNGVACTKKNATTKVGTDKYTCTTNPTATGAAAKKLVWVSSDCITANTTLNKAKAQLVEYQGKLINIVTLQVNSIILWSEAKTYDKGDIVYQAGGTYYVALTNVAAKSPKPSDSLGTNWAINQPSAADSKVGTMPDPNNVVLAKEKQVTDWATTVTTLNSDITRLESKTNLDSKTKDLIKTLKNQVATLNIGIRLANTRIKNLQNSIAMVANNGATDASAILFNSNIETAKASRTMLCQKGL